MLARRVQAYIRSQGLIGPEDTVLLGVSGGADSLCLFFILKEYFENISVMHINHHIRGAEADADEEFVRKLCGEYGIKYFLGDAYLSRDASEDEARSARYALLKAKLCELEPDRGRRKLAIAHTMDDNAETVLYKLIRGSGLRGLGGIRPSVELPDCTLVRPLLDVSRREIEEYLGKLGVCWRNDASNDSDAYARNRLRHHVLPAAAGLNAHAARHIHESASQLAQAEDYISEQADAACAACVMAVEDGLRIGKTAFLKLHPYMQQRLALHCLRELGDGRREISAVHVRELCALFTKPKGKSLDLPGGLVAIKQRSAVLLLRK